MKNHGVSLTELLMSIAVVSVVGAGMYVGFQQVDSARQIAEQVGKSNNSQELLIDLIELETQQTGQNVDTDNAVCLVAASGSGFVTDCDPGVQVNPVGQSHGITLCRKTANSYQTTLFFASGPGPAYGSNRTADLRCDDQDDRFYRAYSKVYTGDACGLPSTAGPDDLTDSALRETNLCQLEFRRSLSGVDVSIQTAGRLIGEAKGNNFSFNSLGSTQTRTVLETAQTLVELDDPYRVSLEQDSTAVAAGANANAQIYLNRIALADVTINYVIYASDGSVVRRGSLTITAGNQTGTITLAQGERLEILSNGMAVADGQTEFNAELLQAVELPRLSLVVYDPQVGYGQGTTSFKLVSDRVLINDLNVWIRVDSLSDSSVVLDAITNASAAGAIQFPTGTVVTPRTAGGASTTDDGGYRITMTSGTQSTTVELAPHPSRASTLGDQDFGLKLVSPSQLDDFDADTPAADRQYQVASNGTQRISLRALGELPTLYWLKETSVAKEPIAGESRVLGITVLASQVPENDLTVNYTLGSETACGTDYSLDAGCTTNTVTIPRGQDRATIEVTLNPHTGLRSDSSNEIELTLGIGNSYVLADPADEPLTHAVTIIEEQVPELSLASSAVTYAYAGIDRALSASTTSTDSFADDGASVPANVRTDRDAILLFEEAATNNTWASGALAIQLNEVEVSGSVYVTLASASVPVGDGQLSSSDILLSVEDTRPATQVNPLVVPFDRSLDDSATLYYWVYNDPTEEPHEHLRLQIDRAVGEGRTRPPESSADGYSLDLVVVDSDQCQIGGGMTLGDSRTDHFHTVGLDTMENETVTAATVRISDSYDSTRDKLLIDGIEPTTGVNTTTYSNASISYNSTTYSGINAVFYTTQGVLEISRSTAIPAPAMVKFFNEKVFFHSNGGTGDRSATFTLGDAQAWDSHEDGTTHYYRFASDDLVQFSPAKTAAESSTNSYFGVPGYLATITSRSENTFLASKFNDNGGPPAGWLGGWDKNLDGTDNEGQWIWINGPERGRRFLNGNTSATQYKVVRGTGNGAGTAAHITREDYQQNEATNGSDHAAGNFELWNMRYNQYSQTIDADSGRVTFGSNPYRFANFARGEPNDSNGEDHLQMTGNSRGGRLWNDLPGDLNVIIGNSNPNYGSPISAYYVRGYYQEFGGPQKSKWGFYNRKFSQTNDFSASSCNVSKQNEGIELATDSCTAWSDLSIGTSSTFDFFGPGTSVSGQNLSGGRVSISDGYVSGVDELAIAGVTANTATVGQKKYLNFSIEYDGTTYNNIDAIFYINQGVLELTRYTTANGTTKSSMPANAMVKVFNNLVEFVHDPTGAVSSSERQVSYTLGEAQSWFNHQDGAPRYYRYIPTHTTWTTANTRAGDATREYFGIRGYLATITSLAENQFLAERFNDNGGPPAGWLGANDAASENNWRWTGGPENGRRFWWNKGTSGRYITGSGNDGSTNTVTKSCVNQTIAWNNSTQSSGDLYRLNYGYVETLTNGVPSGNRRFANWSCYNNTTGMEPNNAGGEDYLQMTGSAAGGGMWNDLRNNQADGEGKYNVKGYYVEYGGPDSYTQNFSDRQLGRSFTINPRECALVREN